MTIVDIHETSAALARAADRLPSLFSLSSEMLELFDLLEDRDSSEEARDDLEQRLALLEAHLAAKAEGYISVVRAKERIAEWRSAEAHRMAELARRDAEHARFLKDRLLQAMQALGVARLETGKYSIRRQKNSRPSVEVLEPLMVPKEFHRIRIIDDVDKDLVLTYVKAEGEVPPGVNIVHGEHIRIS